MKLKIFKFKKINSTNDTAIRIIKTTNNKSGIVIAERQKKGRGKYGKRWKSYKGNLFVTIFFSIKKVKLSLKQLTKINCLLVKKLISHFYKGNIVIKSPNDLLIKKKKISGILQETIIRSGEYIIIIGIGINLIKNPKIKNYPTTSILNLTSVKVSSNIAISKLKKIYERFIPILHKFDVKNINKI